MAEEVRFAASTVLKQDGEHEGRVFVTSELRLIFIPASGDTDASRVWALSDLVAQRQHPRLPLMQIRLQKPDGVTEELTWKFQDQDGASARDTLARFGEALKVPDEPVEAVSQLDQELEAFKRLRKAEELAKIQEDREDIAAGKSDLAAGKAFLVEQGHLAEAEFWRLFESDARVFSSQYVGESNFEGFIGRRVAVTSDPEATLDIPELEKLFTETPKLKDLFEKLVPSSMNATEFWNRVTHSVYFFELQGQSAPEGADHIVNEVESSPSISVDVKRVANPLVEIAGQSSLKKPGFGTYSSEENQIERVSRLGPPTEILCERFNRHANRLINEAEWSTTQLGNLSPDALLVQNGSEMPTFADFLRNRAADPSRVNLRRNKVISQSVLDDLRAASQPADIPMVDITSFKRQKLANAPSLRKQPGIIHRGNAVVAEADVEAYVKSLRSAKANLGRICDPITAKTIFALSTKAIQHTALVADFANIQPRLASAQDFFSRVAAIQTRLRPTLRSFYQCPITQTSLRERLLNAMRALDREVEALLEEMRADSGDGSRMATIVAPKAVVAPVREAINCAVQRSLQLERAMQ